MGYSHKKAKKHNKKQGNKNKSVNKQLTKQGYKQEPNHVIYIPRMKWASALPARYTCCMKYATSFSRSVASGTPVSAFILRADVFDTNDTTVGQQQPYMFDQISPLYRYFIVHGFYYRVTAQKNADNTNVLKLDVLQKSEDLTVGSADLISERPGVQTKLIQNNRENVIIKGYISNNRLWGITTKQMQNESEWWGTATSSPSNLSYLQVYASTPFDETIEMRGYIQLCYYVTWFDLKPQAVS